MSQLPCFNEGTNKPNITGCVCKQGYSEGCCGKNSQGKTPLGFTLKITIICTVSVAFIGSTIALAVYCLKKKNNHVPPKSDVFYMR